MAPPYKDALLDKLQANKDDPEEAGEGDKSGFKKNNEKTQEETDTHRSIDSERIN